MAEFRSNCQRIRNIVGGLVGNSRQSAPFVSRQGHRIATIGFLLVDERPSRDRIPRGMRSSFRRGIDRAVSGAPTTTGQAVRTVSAPCGATRAAIVSSRCAPRVHGIGVSSVFAVSMIDLMKRVPTFIFLSPARLSCVAAVNRLML